MYIIICIDLKFIYTQIWLDEVQCIGNETSIFDCPHNPWGHHDCSEIEDASVICTSTR